MHEFPPASIHVRRHLTRRELGTIALALEVLRSAPAAFIRPELRAELLGDEGLLGDQAIDALARELLAARKVKVCRSKQKPA